MKNWKIRNFKMTLLLVPSSSSAGSFLCIFYTLLHLQDYELRRFYKSWDTACVVGLFSSLQCLLLASLFPFGFGIVYYGLNKYSHYSMTLDLNASYYLSCLYGKILYYVFRFLVFHVFTWGLWIGCWIMRALDFSCELGFYFSVFGWWILSNTRS